MLRVILAATGFRRAVVLLGGALALVLMFPNGKIDNVGPVTLNPSVPIILFAPLLMSMACGIAHDVWRSPVIWQNSRVRISRFVSYALAFVMSVSIVLTGSAVSNVQAFSGMMRNLLWMTGCSIAVAALVGIEFAWTPGFIICGVGIISPTTESPWSFNGMLFHTQATTGQIVFVVLVFSVGLGIGVFDPISRGYLKRSK